MTNLKNLAAIRQEYTLDSFSEEDVIKNPYAQLGKWLDEAIKAEVHEPNAMCLSTIKFDGKPSARIVLLKGFDDAGLIFYTNYNSNKGKQIQANPYVAAVFFWPELQRQIRVEGNVEKVSVETSNNYFLSRPTLSQIAAIASNQSEVISHRVELEERFERLKEQFSKEPIIRPEHWGGYLIKPTLFEFWQGRANRLHDRFLFEYNDNAWKISRLEP